ncbi:MAG: DnaD domain protein [Clostridia bacterium]|nr:DnaD domain protein [Clostridia bacterium]
MTFRINLDSLSSKECFQEASREELRVLLTLVSLRGEVVSEDELARLAGVSPARCRASLVLFTESGVISEGDDVVIDEFPERRSSEERYNKPSTEVAKSVRDSEMASFLSECAKLLDRPALNTEEIKDLEYLITDRGVSQEYLLILIAHLCDRRKCVTARIVMKATEDLLKKGIDTVEALEVYISKLEKTTNEEWEFRNRFEIYRPLSDTEKKYVKKWMCDLGYGIEIVSAAYGVATKTVATNVPFSRMDRILTEWHEAGCTTVDECLTKGEEARAAKRESEKVERPDAPKREKRAKPNETNAKFNDFDTEDALMAAILRSYADESEGGEN